MLAAASLLQLYALPTGIADAVPFSMNQEISMRAFRYVLLAGLLGAAASAQAAPATYEMDPTHTMVIFSWNHFGFSNPVADIGISKGTIVFDKANPSASSVEVTMPLELLDTHVKLLDEHLKKAPFFDAAKNPDITFKSTSVTAGAAGHYTVVGNLTANGVTKPVTLDAVLNGEG